MTLSIFDRERNFRISNHCPYQLTTTYCSFSKWNGTFIEFSEFRESEESLKHELGSVQGSAVLPVPLWSSGIISVSYTGDPVFQPHNACFYFILFLLSLNSASQQIQWKQLEKTPLSYHFFWVSPRKYNENFITLCSQCPLQATWL